MRRNDWIARFKGDWGKLLLVGMVVVGVYSGVVRNGLVWDDLGQVVDNELIKSFGNLGELFDGGNFGSGGAVVGQGKYFKPLMSLWFAVNYWLWGGVEAGGFHAAQVGLHMVNVALVYSLASSVQRLASSSRDKIGGVAFWVALVWGIHPGNVESVVYVSASQEVLYTLFCLLSLLLVLEKNRLIEMVQRITNEELGIRQKMVENWLVSVVCGLWLMGLLSKESAIVWPVIVGTHLWLVEGNMKFLQKYVIGVGVTFGVYLWLRLGVAGIGFFEPHGAVPIINATFWERMLTVSYVLFQHLRVMFFPLDLRIGDYTVVRSLSLEVVLCLLVFLGVVVGLVRGLSKSERREEKRILIWLLIWWLVSVGLVSNIVALDMTFADRWTYMPMLGGVMWVGVWVGMQKSKIKNQNVMKNAKILLGVIVLLFGFKSWERVKDWRNGMSLYGHDVVYAGELGAYDVVNGLGLEYYKLGEEERARELYEKSVEMNPEWWTAYNNLGVYWHNKGDYERAKGYYWQAIEKGNYYLAWENLAVIAAVERDPKLGEIVESGLDYYPDNKRLLEVMDYWEQLKRQEEME